MRARAVRMIVSVVAVVCVLMGLPGAFFASASVWASEQRSLEVQSQLIVHSIDRRRAAGEDTDATVLASLVSEQAKSRGGTLAYRIKIPDANLVTGGNAISANRHGRCILAQRRLRPADLLRLGCPSSNRVGVCPLRRWNGAVNGDWLADGALALA